MKKSRLLIYVVILTLLLTNLGSIGQYANAAEDEEYTSLFELNESGFFVEAFSKTIELDGAVEFTGLITTVVFSELSDSSIEALSNLQEAGELYEYASLTFYPNGKVLTQYKIKDEAHEIFSESSSYSVAIKQEGSSINDYKVDTSKNEIQVGDSKYIYNSADETVTGETILLRSVVYSLDGEVVELPEEEEKNYTVLKDIPYTNDESDERTKMDVFVPNELDGEKENGAFIIVYGGGWTGGSKDGMEELAALYADEGYLTVTINMHNAYHNEETKITEVTVFDMLNNIHDSVIKLKELSDENSWNISYIAMYGGSSGANLSMLYSYSRGSGVPYFNTEEVLPVKFVVNLVGPVDMHDTAWWDDESWEDRDLLTAPGAGPLYAILLTGLVNEAEYSELTEEQIEEYVNAMSPVHYVKTYGGVPTVMGYSKRDIIVNPRNGEILRSYLDNEFIRYDSFIFPKSVHGNYDDPEEAQLFFEKTIEYAEAYFDEGQSISQLSSTGKTGTTVSFKWTAAANGVTELLVEQSPAGQNKWKKANTGSIALDAKSATARGLKSSMSYDFRLVITGGNSEGTTNVVNVSTNAASPIIQPPTDSDTDSEANDELNLGATTTETRNGQTVTKMTIDPKKLEDKLAEETLGSTITISHSESSDVFVVELDGQMAEALESKVTGLELRTEQASYTLPVKQIDLVGISTQFGSDIDLQDIKLQVEIAQPSADTIQLVENAASNGRFTVVVPPIQFSVRALHSETVIEVSQFDAYVERTIAVPNGIDSSSITTAIVVEADGTVRHVPTKIVVKDGKYYAQINSLTNSTYVLVSNPILFNDMTGHWAHEAVHDMGARMIIQGTGSDQFTPDREITRAEFAAILVRGLGLKVEEGMPSFIDVSEGNWFNDFIETAHAYQLISGYEDGTFRPNQNITREEAMVIISKAMAITGLGDQLPEQSAEDVLGGYSDAPEISNWALSSIIDCLQSGIVTGSSQTVLAPQAEITRAEVAFIVQRLLQKSDLI